MVVVGVNSSAVGSKVPGKRTMIPVSPIALPQSRSLSLSLSAVTVTEERNGAAVAVARGSLKTTLTHAHTISLSLSLFHIYKPAQCVCQCVCVVSKPRSGVMNEWERKSTQMRERERRTKGGRE